MRQTRRDDEEKKMKTAAAKTDFIFLSIGGNISPISDPEHIFSNICDLVKEFQGIGVRRVYISEIPPRADFSKSDPPGLTKSKFDRDRKEVLYAKFGANVIKFRDIQCPRDYDGDLVHLSEPTSTNRNCGIRKYLFRIRLVFCSS